MKFFLFIFLFFTTTYLYADEPWEVVKNEHGIKVLLKKLTNSEYKMFRAEAIINVPAETIIATIQNNQSCAVWQNKCATFISLGGNYKLLINSLPWPISDRFVISKTNLKESNKLEINQVPLEKLPSEFKDKLPDLDGLVEMKAYDGFWEFKDLEPNKSKVIFQMHNNPAGSIPSSFINKGVVNMPFSTLLNLQKHLENNKL